MATAAPQVIVCAGGGGVGKTTTSAALALALSATPGESKRRVLVVTVDPARRLADALGCASSEPTQQWVEVDGHPLRVLMPKPEDAMQTFAEAVFAGSPEAMARFQRNPIYASLASALGGIQEFVALVTIVQALDEGYDAVVVDTAPSRHALDFLRYPERLATLLESRAMGWLSGLAERVHGRGGRRAKLVDWGRRRVEGALALLLDPSIVKELAALFTELASERGRVVALAHRAKALLLGPSASFVLVGAPTQTSVADLAYLAQQLGELGATPKLIVLNRAEREPEAWLTESDASWSAAEKRVQRALRQEADERVSAGNASEAALRERHIEAPVVRLPEADLKAPVDVVRALSAALTHLEVPERLVHDSSPPHAL